MDSRNIGPLAVSPLGLGCMGMTFAYGVADQGDCLRTLDRALELGVTLFDTAEVYGPFNNEELLGQAFKGRWDKLVIATKFGFNIAGRYKRGDEAPPLDSRPENVKAVAEASLKRLGAPVIDLFYQHRVDPAVPIEETVGAMAELVREGKVRALGLSEASAATIRRAHAVHPIAAVQTEWSLWSRDSEAEILPTLRELGIAFVPYSPLGRGFLAGRFQSGDDLQKGDGRNFHPRFQGDALAANLAIADTVKRIAGEIGCTPAQLALAWLLNQGQDIIPIPGTTSAERLEENMASIAIELSPARIAEIGAAITPASGERYHAGGSTLIDRS